MTDMFPNGLSHDSFLAPTFKNADIEKYVQIRWRFSDVAEFYDYRAFMLALYREIPQLNERTKMQYVDRSWRNVVVAEWADEPVRFPRPVYVAAAGIRWFLVRWQVRIHAWFVNHRYHEADKPVGWRPWTSLLGYMPMYPDMPVMGSSHVRTIEMKWFGMTFGYDTVFTGGERYRARQFSICCAYDGATDTLYVRD